MISHCLRLAFKMNRKPSIVASYLKRGELAIILHSINGAVMRAGVDEDNFRTLFDAYGIECGSSPV